MRARYLSGVMAAALALLTACAAPLVMPAGNSPQQTPAQTAAPAPTVDPDIVPSLPNAAPAGSHRPVFPETTVPLLDQISFPLHQVLQPPAGVDRTTLGIMEWAPDSRSFAIHGDNLTAPAELGLKSYGVLDLYLGDADTGVLTLFQKNAGWASWSRDSKAVYFLTVVNDNTRPRYDLYRRALADDQPTLLVEDISGKAVELDDGRVVVIDAMHRLAVLEDGVLTPLDKLVDFPALAGLMPQAVSLAPDGHTVAVLSGNALVGLVDLDARTVEPTPPAIVNYPENIAWSRDGQRMALAMPEGILVYDRASRTTQVLVDRADLGISADDFRASFSRPIWSPDERVILFAAATEDWEVRTRLSRSAGFQFAVTADGSVWKGFPEGSAGQPSPDLTKGLNEYLSKKTEQRVPVLVDIRWAQ